jgi:hypothetical protein
MQKTATSCLLLIMLAACTPEPAPTLSFNEREQVDSLFKLHVDSLRPVLDSLCNARLDSAVQFKTDSLMKMRMAEIEKYLQRIKQQTQPPK